MEAVYTGQIRFGIWCPAVRGVVIPMVIHTTQLEPPEPNGTDDPSHLTRLDPTGPNQSDAEHSPTDLAVGVRVPRGALVSAGQSSQERPSVGHCYPA